MKKPLWQMTGEEYVALHAYACSINDDKQEARDVKQCRGVHALAHHIECSDSQVFKLRREGVLDEAIISHIGKSIVFDGEKARELAQLYMEASRGTTKK